MNKIKIGIVGYGNLGRGVEAGLKNHSDMELTGIFTRRDPALLKTDSPAYSFDNILDFQEKIDVLILCGGSKKDIPAQAPKLLEKFNTVDSYDIHESIPNYYKKMNEIAKDNKTVAVISTGWDPGLFSVNRLFQEAILPKGNTYTFWGRGVSQGHSDAVRGIEGVVEAAQYTVPDQLMINDIQKGKDVDYTAKKAHKRDVYVVLKEDASPNAVEKQIKEMPDYFEGYETNVNFISQKEFNEKHQSMPHGGRVIRQGQTSERESSVIDFSLHLESNPEFTAAVDIAYARAAYQISKEKEFGARTVLDIAPSYLSSKTNEELIKELL
ncbi:MAG: diaminopimelate dehydrogenase [Atopostipes suicloacalis]|nr:diaminopimelate dehydrogenase [Atopostipes suicloacalis]MDN6731356.1 diaminopimelate dehydrogenase [Atopostipes suicloacalis]